MSGEVIAYDAGQAGRIIHKSAYWMKKAAREGRIPCTRVGSGYLWTPAQLDEILRVGEKRPSAALFPRSRAVSASATTDDVPILKAREPRPRRRRPAA